MRRVCFLLCVVLFCTGMNKSSKENAPSIQQGIEQILKSVDAKVHVGLEVVSVKSGQKLYQKNSDHLFVPASNLKIFTGAAALHILGPEYQFETTLLTDGKIEGGALLGNVYLKGSGDPSFSYTDLQEIVFRLKMLQVKEIKGNLIIDNTDFDGVVQGPGWMWDDSWLQDKEATSWNAPMDAVVVNHNCIKVWVAPGKEEAKPACVFVHPKTSYLPVHCQATTTVSGACAIKKEIKAQKGMIEVTGSLPLHTPPKSFEVAVPSPSHYAAHLLKEIFQAQEIVFAGETHLGKAPLSAALLASHSSMPLRMSVQHMLKTSDNLYANCFFKKMGQVISGEVGTWQNGSEAVRRFLSKEARMQIGEMVLLDGSGESRYNLVSPHQLTTFLTWMYREFPFAAECMAAFPLAGVDGSLKHRMVDIKGKVRAKGGTMTGISGLTGYVTTKDGELLAFSLLASGFLTSSEEFRTQVEDKICAFLAKQEKILPQR